MGYEEGLLDFRLRNSFAAGSFTGHSFIELPSSVHSCGSSSATANIGKHRHEIGIAVPSWNDVEMEVTVETAPATLPRLMPRLSPGDHHFFQCEMHSSRRCISSILRVGEELVFRRVPVGATMRWPGL